MNDWNDALRRAQRQYDRQEPVEEQMDKEELDRREAEYQEWIAGLRRDIRPISEEAALRWKQALKDSKP